MASKPASSLLLHDDTEIETTGNHQHHQNANTHGDFIRQHLRRCPHGAEDGVFGIGPPARHDDAIHFERGDGKYVQQPGIDVGQYQFRPKRHHGPGGHGRHDGHDGAEVIQELVGAVGADDFLEQQLDHIGNRLQQTQRPHAVGPQPNLHESDEPPLPQHQIGHAQKQNRQQQADAQQDPDNGPQPVLPPAGKAPLQAKIRAAIAAEGVEPVGHG